MNTTEPHAQMNRPRKNFAARDRVLLYLSGLDMADVASLELAAECLRRAGPNPTQKKALTTLRELLREQGEGLDAVQAGTHFKSFPALRRRSMISKQMGTLSLGGSARILISRLFGKKPSDSLLPERKRA